MTLDWSPLEKELAVWRAEARDLPLWWRDDDATEPSAALTQLLNMSAALDLPVHLAVIPKNATTALAAEVAGSPHAVALVHGWAHDNHAPKSAKKAEFGHPRPDALQQAGLGLDRLRGLFGADLLEMFVPPWNRIDAGVVAGLADLGYRALSTYSPRSMRKVSELVQINTHIDPIHWRGGGGLVAPETLINGVVATLQERRRGETDDVEPLGFLTHHLVHDPAVWNFTHRCLSTLLEGGADPINLLNKKDDLP